MNNHETEFRDFLKISKQFKGSGTVIFSILAFNDGIALAVLKSVKGEPLNVGLKYCEGEVTVISTMESAYTISVHNWNFNETKFAK